MRVLLFCVAIALLNTACPTDAQVHGQLKNTNSVQSHSDSENKSMDKAETASANEKITNIKESLKFTDERPAVLSIISSEKLNLKAIGLKKGQILSKHKSGLKSLLTVLEGKIAFVINGETFELNQFDTYEIPVNVEHEIRGIEQSIFSLLQEK